MTAPVNPWSTPPQNTANEAPAAPAAPTPPAAPQAPATPQAPSAPTPPANPLKNDQARNPLAPPAAESAGDTDQPVLDVPADSAEQVDPNPTQAEDATVDTAKADNTAESDDKDDATANDKAEEKDEEKPAPKKRTTRRKPKTNSKSNDKSDGTDPLVAVTELVDKLTTAIERDFTELQSLAPSDALDKIAEITKELDTLNDRAGTAAEKLNELVETISDYRERGTTLRGAYEAVVNAFK